MEWVSSREGNWIQPLDLVAGLSWSSVKWKHCETSQVWDTKTFHYGRGDLALTACCKWCLSLVLPVLEQCQESHRACFTYRAVLLSEGEWDNAQLLLQTHQGLTAPEQLQEPGQCRCCSHDLWLSQVISGIIQTAWIFSREWTTPRLPWNNFPYHSRKQKVFIFIFDILSTTTLSALLTGVSWLDKELPIMMFWGDSLTS